MSENPRTLKGSCSKEASSDQGLEGQRGANKISTDPRKEEKEPRGRKDLVYLETSRWSCLAVICGTKVNRR